MPRNILDPWIENRRDLDNLRLDVALQNRRRRQSVADEDLRWKRRLAEQDMIEQRRREQAGDTRHGGELSAARAEMERLGLGYLVPQLDDLIDRFGPDLASSPQFRRVQGRLAEGASRAAAGAQRLSALEGDLAVVDDPSAVAAARVRAAIGLNEASDPEREALGLRQPLPTDAASYESPAWSKPSSPRQNRREEVSARAQFIDDAEETIGSTARPGTLAFKLKQLTSARDAAAKIYDKTAVANLNVKIHLLSSYVDSLRYQQKLARSGKEFDSSVLAAKPDTGYPPRPTVPEAVINKVARMRKRNAPSVEIDAYVRSEGEDPDTVLEVMKQRNLL